MILDGKIVAEEVKKNLISTPKPDKELAIVLVGDDPVSKIYISKKLEFAAEVGITTRFLNPEKNEIEKIIAQLNNDPQVGGIIVQLPLPSPLEAEKILLQISPAKDVDGGHFILSEVKAVIPPTVLSIFNILQFYEVRLDRVVIVGGGLLVGRPLQKFLKQKNIIAEILLKDDPEYENKLKNAEVCVIATGGGRVFHQDDFKTGATVIDASTVSDDQKVRGDVVVEPNDQIKLAPVPGGVGPLTVAMLFKNFFDIN